jgi:hypothetical protein
MRVDITINQRQLGKLQERLAGTRRNITKPLAQAINDTTKQLRTKASANIRAVFAVKKGKLDSRIQRTFATDKQLVGFVTLKEKPEIALKYFQARQNKSGVKVKIRKSGSARFYKSAFGPKIKKLGNHVWKRTGKQRLPIEKQPGVKLAVESEAIAAMNRARREAKSLLKKNTQRRVNLLVLRQQGKAK